MKQILFGLALGFIVGNLYQGRQTVAVAKACEQLSTKTKKSSYVPKLPKTEREDFISDTPEEWCAEHLRLTEQYDLVCYYNSTEKNSMCSGNVKYNDELQAKDYSEGYIDALNGYTPRHGIELVNEFILCEEDCKGPFHEREKVQGIPVQEDTEE